MPDQICFYSTKGQYGCFSNFSAHPVEFGGQVWPTSEHAFQGQKFLATEHQQAIRQAKSPMIAARMGRDRKRPLRADWEAVKLDLMGAIVLAKFTQHADLHAVLLATGDAQIIEHTTNDAYWGDGGDGHGQNWLGRILMEVRVQLASTKSVEHTQPTALQN